VAEFSPIAENFTPTGPSPEVSWESALTTPVPGYVDTDVSGSFDSDTSDDPYAFPSVSGAAVSVEQSLSKITFVQGTSGQMSSSIAYIRYWSRKGTQQKTAVSDNPVNGAVSDPQGALLEKINTLSYGVDLNLSPVTQSNQQARPPLAVPTNTAYQSQIRRTTLAPSSPTNAALNRLGSIFSANPGGTTAPAWANPFASQPAAPSPDNAVWQFLFNPEELQLSSGPDFNRAETWGVSDPANSGQPLSWRSNKNRKLTFGRVLLHGYTFGRRVDSLEKGLQQLFEARDGENGADGPPVLEFVWGQRVFGPCVIQNIQVREKAWDKGLLVNAEVSFDLEQVPEWTINDEFVDVLRPGRQSTVNDPTVASEGYRDTSSGDDKKEEEKKDKPGGGGGNPDPSSTYDKNLCKFATDLSGNFDTLVSDTKRWIGIIRIDPVIGPLPKNLDPAYRESKQFKDRFERLKNKLVNSSEITKYVDKNLKSKSPGCLSNNYAKTVSELFEDQRYASLVKFINKCSSETSKLLINWWSDSKNKKCQFERIAVQDLRKRKEGIGKCKQFEAGQTCSSPSSRSTCPTANGGRTVACRKNKKPGPANVWTLE
jgi:hypothetical protein